MRFELRGLQATVADDLVIEGIGVHSGELTEVRIKPAAPDTGIVFSATCQAGNSVSIPARVPSISCTAFCTAIGRDGVVIGTIEHLMAALHAAGIDNAEVEMCGSEVPVLDGSADGFLAAIEETGIEYQAARRRYIRVLKTVRVENGASWAEFSPHDGTEFDVEIEFDCPTIGRQRFVSELTTDVFRRELASARTFGFLKDVERLWAAGRALGSALDNSVVIGNDDRVINPEGLRWADEFVRHKTLDAVGDLALAGAPFIGRFRSHRGGHALNADALRRLLTTRDAFEIVETHEPRQGKRGLEVAAVSAAVSAPFFL